jgi:DNA repair exonuclease SbcCD ATPase subunit
MTQYAEETDTQDLHRQEIEQRDATIALLKQQLEEKGRGANPDHMPWSSLKWTGDEPGVAKIAAESRRQMDEQSRIYLYGRLKDVEKELADKDKMIEELTQELNGTQKLLKDAREQLADKDKMIEELAQELNGTQKLLKDAHKQLGEKPVCRSDTGVVEEKPVCRSDTGVVEEF